MKYLILIDRTFPFKSGETFIENEIEEVSPFFDKVIIYPIDVNKLDRQTRIINSRNVDIRIINDDSFKKRKIKSLLHGIFSLNKKNVNKKMLKRMQDNYFLHISKIESDKIIIDLGNYNFEKDDEIYLYSYWLYTTAQIAVNLKQFFKGKVKKIKTISRAHRFDIYEDRRKSKYLPMREELISELDNIFPCSDDGTKYLKDKYPQYSNKMVTSYLGTYDRGISVYNFSNKIEIVSCSNVIPVKRVDLIIKSLELLKKSNFEIEWTHIGGGEKLNQIKRSANKKIPFVKCKFLGKVSNSTVYEYYKNNSVRIFINVSSSEGLPVSIMEAISFGIPVIATNVGGTCEIVNDDVSGFLLKKNFKCEDLAKKIEMIAKMDEIKYLNLRKNTRILWEKKFQANENYKLFAKKIKK